MTFIGLDHVHITAPPGCEAEARAFYGGLVGLEEIEKPLVLALRGGVWFVLGTQEVHIGVDERFVPQHRAHPGMVVSSPEALDELAAKLEAAGYELAWADPIEIPGRVRFHVADPFGNRLEFLAST